MLEQVRTDGHHRRLASMVLCYSLASSLVGIFLPAYYLKLSSDGLIWIVEFLATQFLLIGIVPRITLRFCPSKFERLMFFGFGFYIIYNILLIELNNPFVIGISAGLALATFWPSFNTLQLRISTEVNRAETINTLSILVMTIGSTIGPVVGALIISFGGGFPSALIVSSLFYLAAYVAMRKFDFHKVTYTGRIFDAPTGTAREEEKPKSYTFRLFALGYTFQGLSEITWFVYPIYVLAITGSYLALGIAASAISLIVALMSVSVGRLADSRKSRFTFIMVGLALNIGYYAFLPSVQNEIEIILSSVIIGIASALTSNIFALMGDRFSSEQYPSLMARVEAYLAIGRIVNLGIMVYFMQNWDYAGYFYTSAFILSFAIPVYYLMKRKIDSEEKTSDLIGVKS